MASSKTLIKNGISDVVYRFVNDSATNVQFTVTLAELARADQTISGTATAGISSLTYCTAGAIKVSRNANVQYFFSANSGEHTNAYATDYDNKDQSITVDITSGVLTLRLLKGGAYINT